MQKGTIDSADRPFHDGDIPLLRQFLVDIWRSADLANGCFHVGDLLWGRYMYEDSVLNPADRVRIWEEPDGSVRGFAWMYPPNEVELNIHPSQLGDRELLGSMLAWAGERRKALARDDPVKPLATSILEDDNRTASWLLEAGFARSDRTPMLYFTRGLDEPIPESVVPDGFAVRPLRGEEEYEERVAIHREVFHPSRVTIGAYRRLRTIDGYDPDLDLVADAPDDTFAAYAILWYDAATQTAEFEPVGARSAFRQRGLTKAVLLEGLRRVRERGAQLAVVYTHESNEPARRLYESVGFQVVNKWLYWERPDRL